MTQTSPTICVFCGAANGNNPAFAQAAEELGHALGKAGMSLVYGGGRAGLMGVVAQACHQADGHVIGIIPSFLDRREIANNQLSELVVVDSMHARKEKMYARSDAFVVLPGGYGTLDETIEILTWRQLGQHEKPIFVLNVENYWDPMMTLLDHVVANGFAHADTSSFVEAQPDVVALMTRLQNR